METIETYYSTKNEHWNTSIFNCHTEAVKSGLFTDPETPLYLFGQGFDLLKDNHKTPDKGLNQFFEVCHKHELTNPQKLFILDQLKTYFYNTEFDEVETWAIIELLKSHIELLKPTKPKVANLRETLKAIVQTELETLPETIKGLEPIQRLTIVTKLIPFVMPRVESVHFEKGEGNGWSL